MIQNGVDNLLSHFNSCVQVRSFNMPVLSNCGNGSIVFTSRSLLVLLISIFLKCFEMSHVYFFLGLLNSCWTYQKDFQLQSIVTEVLATLLLLLILIHRYHCSIGPGSRNGTSLQEEAGTGTHLMRTSTDAEACTTVIVESSVGDA